MVLGSLDNHIQNKLDPDFTPYKIINSKCTKDITINSYKNIGVNLHDLRSGTAKSSYTQKIYFIDHT